MVVASVVAAVDWMAVAFERRRLEYVAKPLVPVALVVAAVASDAPADVRGWFVVALLASLAGDVVLMTPGAPFMAGLGAFLVAHVAFVAAFAADGATASRAAWAVPVLAVGAALVGRRLVAAVRARGARGLTAGVVVYMAAISAMVAAAAGTGDLVAVAAAGAFYVSDGLLGWDRFVERIRRGKLWVHCTYHLAQIGFVTWLALDASS